MIIVIVSEPTIGRFSAHLTDGTVLAHGSRVPFFDSCRKLVEMGTDPNEIAVMRYHGSDVDCLTARTGDGAWATVAETDLGPRFIRWKPFPVVRSAQGASFGDDPVSDTGDD